MQQSHRPRSAARSSPQEGGQATHTTSRLGTGPGVPDYDPPSATHDASGDGTAANEENRRSSVGAADEADVCNRAASALPQVSLDRKAGAGDLQSRWSVACTALQSLPSHARIAQLLPNAAPVLRQHTASVCTAHALQRCCEDAGIADVVLQIALLAPDAHFAKTQTLLAQAGHTLAQLKDAIWCANDKHATDELGSALLGGMFYLSDTLYSDTRDANADGYVEYESRVQAFLESRAQHVSHDVTSLLRKRGIQGGVPVATPAARAKSAAMQDVTLAELAVSISRPGRYLYVHAGACEHVLVFEDVRLKHADDPDVDAAPATLPPRHPRLEKCCVCMVRPAVKVSFDDVSAPESPALLCDACFDDLHLDSAGGDRPDAAGLDVYRIHG